jgi:putative peptidoglycan lipid II flippase
VLAKVFTPPFFARQDMRRPMNFAIITVVVNIVLGASLYFGLGRLGVDGVVGLAIATSISAWLNVLLLSGTLARERVYRPSRRVVSRLLRIVAASAVMGLVLWLCAVNYETLSGLLWRKELAVVVACLAGFGVYGAAVLLFRAVSPAELRASLRREAGAAPPSIGLE